MAACCSRMAPSRPTREWIRSIRRVVLPRENAGRCAASTSNRAAPDARSSDGEASVDCVYRTRHVARFIAKEECGELRDLIGGRETSQGNLAQHFFLSELLRGREHVGVHRSRPNAMAADS